MFKILPAIGAVAVATALLLPTASIASTVTDDDAIQTASVSYADLDLADQHGTNVLQGRIKSAAQQLCGTARPVELDVIKANQACMIGAVASAQPAFIQAVAAAHRGSVTVIQGASLIVTAPMQ